MGSADEAPLPDGTRLRDSLCGTLATSGVLYTLRVRFSYINNCRVEDEEFRSGVDRFVRAARVVKRLRSMKIGQVGQRIDFFWSTIANEADLLQRFGIQVKPIDLADMCRTIRRRTEANRAAYHKELAERRSGFALTTTSTKTISCTTSPCGTFCWKPLRKTTWTVSASRTSVLFPMSSTLSSTSGCSLIADAGYPVAPESDLYGAVSSVLIEAASPGDEPSFLPEPTIRHPTNDNAVLLWHGHVAAEPASSPTAPPRWICRGF